MSSPVSLRNIPPQALQIAHHLCEQTGLSIADVLRQAIVSGLLVEATRFAPDHDGTLGGLEATYLAKALRRHLSSAIDLLLEQGQHPYQELLLHDKRRSDEQKQLLAPHSSQSTMTHGDTLFATAIGDDLDALGIGISLAETLGNTSSPHND